MQPYFFPYLGYFQLMASVDVFVFLDDVQYIKRGYVNRNAISVGGRAYWLSKPVAHAPREALIKERHYVGDESLLDRWERTLRQAYGRCAGFAEAGPAVLAALRRGNPNVAEYNSATLRAMADLLHIGPRTLASSDLGLAPDLRGQERILAICKALKAEAYINAAGGVDLYDADAFRTNGFELMFLNTLISPTDLVDGSRHLSVIHHLLFGGAERTRAAISEYRLVPARSEARTV